MPDQVPPPTEPSFDFGSSGDDRRLLPQLSVGQWLTFALIAGVLAATNIYTTLLIGWGDTGSIVAVLAAVLVLGLLSRTKPALQVLNIGQTMASAGGSIGFALACYAAVYIAEPGFEAERHWLILFFIGAGMLGTLLGASVRRQMVGYFFPSGTACAVIQRAVAAPLLPGQRNRPVWMLTVWGTIASLLTLPTKIAGEAGHAIFQNLQFRVQQVQVGLSVDPLYYGIGIVVGPRVGIGMVLGALVGPFLVTPLLEGTAEEPNTTTWVRWIAIAVLTLPTFATILFAYRYRQPAVIPAGFVPGRTQYARPASSRVATWGVALLAVALVIVAGQQVFGLPPVAAVVVAAVSFPLCIVNGRVAGDTDINPVRLVAIVLLSVLFWMVDDLGVVAMLGMAVVGGTLASIAVDIFQDYRTGYLVDANPTHQTSVQILGAIVGAVVGVPVLLMLLEQMGVGEGSGLPAPASQVWAAMAQAMAGGFSPSTGLVTTIVAVSLGGIAYAYLTVWPRTAPWMPSLFGIGIGLLVGIESAAAIFAGGMIKWVATLVYTSGKGEAAQAAAREDASNDTMLAGASIFAAAAVVSIVLVLAKTAFDAAGLEVFDLAH
jgi:uncharacterized oligopeptide transporter (OPT) family protein